MQAGEVMESGDADRPGVDESKAFFQIFALGYYKKYQHGMISCMTIEMLVRSRQSHGREGTITNSLTCARQ